MSTIPYIHFQGQCADALAFYADVFGGTQLQVMRYADAPDSRPEWAGLPHAIHGQVTLRGATLMASDFPPGMEGDRQKAVSIMQTMPDMDSARAAFDRLTDGGEVILPFGPTFFSPGYGMVKDRFGTHWMVAVEAPAP